MNHTFVRATVPDDEADRLESLSEYQILDTLPEESYDRLTRIAAALCKTPIALISLLDRDRQWFKSALGIKSKEISRDVSFCSYAVMQNTNLIVEDTLKDPSFRDNPLVLCEPNIRFYAGELLRGYNGQPLGTLCVIDTVPRTLGAGERELLSILAREIEANLELRRMKHLNEQLAHMTIHDLRTPQTVIMGYLKMLSEDNSLGKKSRRHVSIISNELRRSVQITNNFIDLLQEGVGHLRVNPVLTDLKKFFGEIIDIFSFHAVETRRKFKSSIDITINKVLLDSLVLRRILDNLFDNAIKYSQEDGTIALNVVSLEDKLIIRVINEGIIIPDQEREKVFDLYYRLDKNNQQIGAGLGLAFCKMATKNLQGKIEIEDVKFNGTSFRLDIPFTLPTR